MEINSSQACGINPTPYDAYDADSTDFTWTSSKPSVVSVSPSGVLTTNSAWGNSTIRATHKTYTNLTSSAKVIVYVPMISFTIDGPTTMVVNSSACCCVVPNPCNAYYQENSFFTWTSDDESILTVDDEGYITSHSAGSCRITAAHKFYPNMTNSVNITVSGSYATLTGFTINGSESMVRGSAQILSLSPKPPNAPPVSITDVSWSLSGDNVLNISEDDGMVVAGSFEGICKITATHKIHTNLSAFLDVTVTYSYSDSECYINNLSSGHFLTNTGSGTPTASIYTGNNQKWKLEHVTDGKYKIISEYNNMILLCQSDNVVIESMPSIITDEYKWSIPAALGGFSGVIIKNEREFGSDKVLYDNGSSITLQDEMSHGNINYIKSAWLIPDEFVPLTDFTINCSENMLPFSSQTCGITETTPGAQWIRNTDFTWIPKKPSILTVSSDGVITSNVNAGTCEITATHKPTGLSKGVDIAVSGASLYSPEEGLYAIHLADNNRYRLSYVYSNNVRKVDCIYHNVDDNKDLFADRSQDEFGEQMWYFKEYSSTNHTYVIYNMAKTGTTDHLNNYVLTEGANGAVNLTVMISTPTNNKLWQIYSVNDHVLIKNYSSHNFLNGTSTDITVTENGDLWTMVTRENADYYMYAKEMVDFNTLFPYNYNYSENNSEKDIVEFVVKNSCDPSHYSNALINNSVSMWSGITDKINIVGPGGSNYKYNDVQYSVEVVEADLDDEYGHVAFGKMEPLDGDGNFTDYSFSCKKFRITLTTKSKLLLASDSRKARTIAHEMGHVLGLLHLEESIDASCGYSDDTTMLSIMNYVDPDNNNYLYQPSWLDKVNIIEKWGK